jgi:hypothetical protein
MSCLLDVAQHHQFISEQFQGPAAAALGWVAASQSHQLLLDVPLDLDLVRPGRLCLAIHGGRQTLGDELLAHPGDGARANAKSSDDGVVAVARSIGDIRQQQDAGVGQFAGRRLPRRYHSHQALALFF